jgi:hypothetical protein
MSFDQIKEMAMAGCFNRLASLEEFANTMFGEFIGEVPPPVLDQFYEDYMMSGMALDDYEQATTEITS